MITMMMMMNKSNRTTAPKWLRYAYIKCDLSGSHGGKYEDESLVGCRAEQSRKSLLTFET
jgi:hypothetical protein